MLIEAYGRLAYLAKSGGDAATHVARRLTCGVMMASSFVGGARSGTPRERFDEAAAGPGAKIAPVGEGMLLVVDCEAELPNADPQNVIDLGDFGFSMGTGGDAPLRETVSSVRSAALAALALSGFQGVTDDGTSLGSADILYHPADQRPFYVVEMEIGFTTSSKSALLPDQALEAARLSSALDRATKGLRYVPRLLARSHAERLQPLNSFISAWAGLEILVVSSFSRYEAMFSSALNVALPPGAVDVADRMRDVMKDKYRLADKFAIMAGALDPDLADEDVATFNQLKKVRDAFFHTLTTSPADLPADGARRLLRKFLKLHLEQS